MAPLPPPTTGRERDDAVCPPCGAALQASELDVMGGGIQGIQARPGVIYVAMEREKEEGTEGDGEREKSKVKNTLI